MKRQPVNDWIEQELATADLGDKRLTERMKLILKRISESPMASLKTTFKGWAEVIGAYRFFSHPDVNVENVLRAHRQSTFLRIKEHSRVLVIQDTSELDYSRKKSLKGAGPLSDTGRLGFFAHTQFVISSERLPLGIWNTDIYSRDEQEHGKAQERKQKPIEQKESYRWLKGYRDACSLAEELERTQVISCMDREGDIYEIYEEWQGRSAQGRKVAEWLIRCNQDRLLECVTDEEQETDANVCRKIRDKVQGSSLLGTVTIHVKAKEQVKKVKGGNRKKVNRSARVAILEVRVATVTIHPPYRKGKKLPPVTFHVVMAAEKDPPANEEPIAWVLLTSLKVADFHAAVEVVDLYRGRWEIEVFHRVLKTGCRVEELQLKKDQRTMAAVALYMVVAWRVLYVMKLGRECPDLPCDVVFDEDEWQSVWVINYGEPALAQKPSLGQFVIKVAELGGFLARRADGVPGAEAIWQGLTRVRDFTLAWQIYVKKCRPLHGNGS